MQTAESSKWTEPSERIFYINNNVTAAEREKAEFETVSEYKIGHTTYIVTTKFNPAFQESLQDILQRLMLRDCEKLIGENI